MKNIAKMTEEEWDRHRLPQAISRTLHHISDLEREIIKQRSSGIPGDKFRAARNAWFLRNNRRALGRLYDLAAEVGLTLQKNTQQLALFE